MAPPPPTRNWNTDEARLKLALRAPRHFRQARFSFCKLAATPQWDGPHSASARRSCHLGHQLWHQVVSARQLTILTFRCVLRYAGSWQASSQVFALIALQQLRQGHTNHLMTKTNSASVQPTSFVLASIESGTKFGCAHSGQLFRRPQCNTPK